MPVSDETIVIRLRALLEEVDLQTTSERKLRETIEAELKEDLSERKALIRQEVQAYLLKQQEEEDEDVDEDDEPQAADDGDDKDDDADEFEEEKVQKPKRKRKSAFGSKLSTELQEFLGVTSMPRTEVVKKIWEYIKENNLQNPDNKRKIILDNKLKTIFKPPLDMFKMNKQLSKHVYVDDSNGYEEAQAEEEEADEEDADEDDDEGTPPKKAPNKRKGGGARRAAEPKEPKKRRASTNGSGLTGSALSPALQEFLGLERLARPQVVKQLWEYIRANNLQDPDDKRNIIVDDKLGTLFQAPLNMFNINKQLTPHILKGE